MHDTDVLSGHAFDSVCQHHHDDSDLDLENELEILGNIRATKDQVKKEKARRTEKSELIFNILKQRKMDVIQKLKKSGS